MPANVGGSAARGVAEATNTQRSAAQTGRSTPLTLQGERQVCAGAHREKRQ
jgi:hypothetical protein